MTNTGYWQDPREGFMRMWNQASFDPGMMIVDLMQKKGWALYEAPGVLQLGKVPSYRELMALVERGKPEEKFLDDEIRVMGDMRGQVQDADERFSGQLRFNEMLREKLYQQAARKDEQAVFFDEKEFADMVKAGPAATVEVNKRYQVLPLVSEPDNMELIVGTYLFALARFPSYVDFEYKHLSGSGTMKLDRQKLNELAWKNKKPDRWYDYPIDSLVYDGDLHLGIAKYAFAMMDPPREDPMPDISQIIVPYDYIKSALTFNINPCRTKLDSYERAMKRRAVQNYSNSKGA